MATSKIPVDQFATLEYKEATVTVSLNAGGIGVFYTNEISGYTKVLPVNWRTPPEFLIYALNMNSSGININRVDIKNISATNFCL